MDLYMLISMNYTYLIEYKRHFSTTYFVNHFELPY